MGVQRPRLAREFVRVYGGSLDLFGERPDGEPVAGSGLLKALSERMGLDALGWAAPGRDPLVGGRGYGLRAFVQCVDWTVLARLPAGDCVDLRSEAHPCSGRMRAFAGHGFMVKTSNGCGGTLVGLASIPVHGSPAQWLQLAEWVSDSFTAKEERRMVIVQERERRLGRQTAALNHDLRNHLNLALMQLERLQVEGLAPRAGDPGIHGGDAVNLVDLSRSLGDARDLCAGAVVGDSGLERRRIPLRPRLLAQGRAARELSACGEDVRVLVRCSKDIVVRGHPSHLERLIKNLVSNAIEASSVGGEVRLEASAKGTEIVLNVIDQGRGMDHSARTEWMHPGQSGSGGTGYGSASLQECLDELGGRLEVTSAPGRGTRVSVCLPCAPPSKEPLLLLVDPDSRRRARRSSILERQGQAVAQAGSLEAARTWLSDVSVEGVLMARGLRGGGLVSFRAAARRAGLEVTLVGVEAGELQRAVEAASRHSQSRGK